MKKPTLQKDGNFYTVTYSYKQFDCYKTRSEAFTNEKYAKNYWLTKIDEYKTFQWNLDIGM